MNIENELRALTDGCTKQLAELVRRAALESVQDALGQAGATPRRRPGRPRKAATVADPKRSPAPTPSQRAAGEKRPLEELATTTEKLAAYITASPGQGIEQIKEALGVATRALAPDQEDALGEADRVEGPGAGDDVLPAREPPGAGEQGEEASARRWALQSPWSTDVGEPR